MSSRPKRSTLTNEYPQTEFFQSWVDVEIDNQHRARLARAEGGERLYVRLADKAEAREF